MIVAGKNKYWVPRNGLIGYWHGQDAVAATGTLIDRTTTGANATLSNNVSVVQGSGYYNANQSTGKADLADLAAFQCANYTFMAWVYLLSPTNNGISWWLWSKSLTGGSQFLTFYANTPVATPGQFTVGLAWHTASGLLNQWAAAEIYPDTPATASGFSYNTWTHLGAIVYGTEETHLYINGVRRSIQAGTSPLYGAGVQNAGAAMIGNRTALTRGGNGYIDGLRVYNRAMSDDEFLNTYNKDNLHPRVTYSTSWYTGAGAVPAANCIGAYRARGAASQAASYVNLANPGVYDLTVPSSAPTWNTATGWSGDGTQWFSTGINPAGTNKTYSAIFKYKNATTTGTRGLFGYHVGLNDSFQVAFQSGTHHVFSSGYVNDTHTPLGHGTIYIAGNQFSWSGLWGSTIPAGSALASGNILLMSNGEDPFIGDVIAFAVYDIALTADQISAILVNLAVI